MTTYTASVTSPTDVTSMRVWGRAIQDAFTACGLVQTDDTGQVTDWNTVGYPTATATPHVYQIFRFDDSHQSTRPLIVKVEYRYHSTNLNWYLAIFIGTATNGAGVITSTINLGYNIQYNTAGSTARYTDSRPIYAFGDGSSFWMVYGYHPTSGLVNGAGGFFIERTRDTGGNSTPDGATWGMWGSGPLRDGSAGNISTTFANLANNTVVAYGTMQFPGIWLPNDTAGTASAALAGDIGVMPSAVLIGNKWYPPLLCGVTHYATDLAPQSLLTVPMYGAPHQYLVMGPAMSSYSSMTQRVNHCMAMRWE